MDSYEKEKVLTKRYKKVKNLLRKTFGYDNFKPLQYEIINNIINKKDVCAVLPTGYGKSLTFQLPALYVNKPAIIISPLISLMDDQKIILEKLGITSCCYNSNVKDKYKMRSDILENKYQFIYITPESVVNMQNFIKELDDELGISLVAIDEAHCISSYGFDFRKSYRDLTIFKTILPHIPILAVTATATTTVAKDICKVLKLNNNKIIKTSFDRPNLYLEARRKSKIEDDIIPLITKYEDHPIIIYCLTKKETVKIYDILQVYGIESGIYHSGIDHEEKTKIHNNFLKDKIKIIVATIAFGMGINKSNVRVVIHYGAPKNIEGYYQEIGRAGRDGEEAFCYVFYSSADFVIQRKFIANGSNPSIMDNQIRLLERFEKFLLTTKCRRQILLEYFDQEMDDKCFFCDNCCGNKVERKNIITVEQNIEKEAKILIELIEYLDGKFGMNMYIDIVRGSNNKKISSRMKKSKHYGIGKSKSKAWWKEMSDNLIKLGYLQKVNLQGSKTFAHSVVKATRQGISWVGMADLKNVMNNLPDNGIKIPLIMMETKV